METATWPSRLHVTSNGIGAAWLSVIARENETSATSNGVRSRNCAIAVARGRSNKANAMEGAPALGVIQRAVSTLRLLVCLSPSHTCGDRTHGSHTGRTVPAARGAVSGCHSNILSLFDIGSIAWGEAKTNRCWPIRAHMQRPTDDMKQHHIRKNRTRGETMRAASLFAARVGGSKLTPHTPHTTTQQAVSLLHCNRGSARQGYPKVCYSAS